MPDEMNRETVVGYVSDLIFRNDDNGYTILRIECKKEMITVVGCMPGISVGEEIEVTGQWVRHPVYGPQLKAETVQSRVPSTSKAIYSYLASGAVKGIGIATARRIVEAFGEDSIDMLENHPEEVAKLKGITQRKADEISAYIRQQSGMRHLMEFLTMNEMPLSLGATLWKTFGEDAVTIIKGNPYMLAGEPYRLRFTDVDRFAIRTGIGPESPIRAEAGVISVLTAGLGDGNVFLPEWKLLSQTCRRLGLDQGPVEQAVSSLISQGRLIREHVAGEDACYLATLYYDECAVADRLREMAGRGMHPPKDIDAVIDRIEREQGIEYAPQQREAVRLAASRQVMLLTGGPGTGKTTSLRGILSLFDAMHLKTALAAPTGRAAKRLGDLCGTDAATIHRLLETGFDNETGEMAFSRNESDPLNVGAVIVDETSMVDISLMAALLAALKGDCRLILVGDPDQLPSVGPGNLFADLIASGLLPTVRLTEIFRQAQESAIIMNAHSINRGIVPNLRNRSAKGDFFFLSRNDPERAAETIVDLCTRRLPDNMGIQPEQIQVLSPTRKGITGTANLNKLLQEALNPKSSRKNERKFGSFSYREGDRVMQIKNNYDIMWESADRRSSGLGIFNGDVGIIEEITPSGDIVTVNFEDRIVEYTPDMLDELEPAFAMTVHKSQGSEYRAVVLAALDGAPMLLSRRVLYTGVTRARELLVIVGSEEVVASMCMNDRHDDRCSGLRERLLKNE